MLGNLRARGELLGTRAAGLVAVIAVVVVGRELEATAVVALVAAVIVAVGALEARTHAWSD